MGERPEGPLDVDPELCRRQLLAERLRLHVVLTAMTLGLWSPVLLGRYLTSRKEIRRSAFSTSVQLLRDGLVVTTSTDAQSTIRFEAISSISVDGPLVVLDLHDEPPVRLYGLRDPVAAACTIRDASGQ
jgi:hypothetical protein